MIKQISISKLIEKINGAIYSNTTSSSDNYSSADELQELSKAIDELLESYSMAQETIRMLNQQLKKNNLYAIMALIEALNAKDPYTKGHSERVSIYSLLLSERLGLTDEEIDSIYIASYLHDVGKIGIHEQILNKPDKLTGEEYEIVKGHAEISSQIVSHISELEHIASIVKHHHERHDGSGYPEGLKGEEIPLGSRILAIADAFDAMTSVRPYRDAYSPKEALEEIKRCSGKQFDPDLAPLFIDAYAEAYGDKIPHLWAS